MTEEVRDIFGKIDALVERRDVDILGDKSAQNDDFPRLTEVIDNNIGDVWSGLERRAVGSGPEGGHWVERRLSVRRKRAATDMVISQSGESMNALLFEIERRLTETLARQHIKMQAELHSILRDVFSGGADKKL